MVLLHLQNQFRRLDPLMVNITKIGMLSQTLLPKSTGTANVGNFRELGVIKPDMALLVFQYDNTSTENLWTSSIDNMGISERHHGISLALHARHVATSLSWSLFSIVSFHSICFFLDNDASFQSLTQRVRKLIATT